LTTDNNRNVSCPTGWPIRHCIR